MDKITQGMLAAMDQELQQAAIGIEDKLQLAERSFLIVEAHMQKLKEYILSYQFKNKEEEMQFFKSVKPLFQKELIYFYELLSIESDKPLGSKEKQKEYYTQCLGSIEVFFGRNQYLYNYYRGNKEHSDESFFLRQSPGAAQLPVYTHDLDRSFSTPYSFIFSKLQAFEKLREYLLRAMESDVLPEHGNPQKKRPKLTWTDSNAALIELLYGIKAKGSVNHGNVSMKDLVTVAEDTFNIRLGNVYPVVNGFGIRKKGRTPYLHGMIDSLENDLDDKDE